MSTVREVKEAENSEEGERWRLEDRGGGIWEMSIGVGEKEERKEQKAKSETEEQKVNEWAEGVHC